METRGYSPNTITNTDIAVTGFIPHIKRGTATPETVTDWIDALKASGNAAGTINAKRHYLSGFFRYLQEVRGHAVMNPVTRNTAMREESKTDTAKEAEALTQDEIRRIIAFAQGCRQGVAEAIKIMAATGLRLAEFTSLQRGGLQPDGLTINQGKGKKTRFVTVSPALMDYVVDTFPLWCDIPRRSLVYEFEKAAALAGVDKRKAHIHALRRAFITKLVNSGIAIEIAQEMAGHASISTTRRYCYVSKDRLAAAAEVAAGIA